MTDQRLVSLLKQASTFLDQYEKNALKGSGLTPSQNHMLSYLLTIPDQTFNATEIRMDTGISKAAISGALKGLKQKGYLNIRSFPTDERKKQITLTSKALRARESAEEYQKLRAERLFHGISREELDALESILTKIIGNIKHENPRRNSYDTYTDGTD